MNKRQRKKEQQKRYDGIDWVELIERELEEK